MKGISGDGGSVEVDAVGSGLASARGSASSMKWTAAELLDTVARRGVDGGRGYGEGVAAMASAMAWESEGEELERRGGVWEVQRREGDRSMASPGEGSGEAASRCVARAAVAVGHLPACLAGKQLAGAALGWAGRWAGCWCQVRFCYSLFSVF